MILTNSIWKFSSFNERSVVNAWFALLEFHRSKIVEKIVKNFDSGYSRIWKGGRHARMPWFAIYLLQREGKCKIRIFDRWPGSQTSGREYADSEGNGRPHDFTPPGGPPMEKLRSECLVFFALRHSCQLEIFETFPSTTFCPPLCLSRFTARAC